MTVPSSSPRGRTGTTLNARDLPAEPMMFPANALLKSECGSTATRHPAPCHCRVVLMILSESRRPEVRRIRFTCTRSRWMI